MATWKDGAAYAPVERPDGFATPVAEPLPGAAPYRAATPGPMAHPSGFGDMPPQQPLATLGDKPAQSRDPKAEFTIASSMLTAGGAAEGPRNPRTPFATAPQSALDTAPPPPTGTPLPAPAGQPLAPPPGYPMAPPTGAPVPSVKSHRTLAIVAAVLCFVGLVASSTAPFMLLVAGVIGLRTKPVTKSLGPAALSLGAAGVFLQLLFNAQTSALFTAVWGLMALAGAIGFLTTSLSAKTG